MMSEVFGEGDIPVGIRVGTLVHLLRIAGAGRTVEEQLDGAFEGLGQAIGNAGATLDNVAQVSFFLKHREDIPKINPPWVRTFPDEHDRPTYKFMQVDLPGDRLVHMEAFALQGERRTSIQIPGVAHTNPIPMGVRIGNMLFSSRVLPYDAATGRAADGAERQTACLFDNVRTLLNAAGMQPHTITQGRLFLAHPEDEARALEHWRRLVAPAKPALHVTPYTLAPSLLVMLEVIAVA